MSEPKYIKDSKQFTVVFRNVAEHLIQDNSRMEEEFGIVGNRQIVAIIKRRSRNDINYMGLFFRQEKINDEDEEKEDKIESVEAEIVAVLEGKDPIVAKLNSDDGPFESGSGYGYLYWRQLDMILNEENGYVKDGALTLHVEMRIHCLIGKDGIRRFNFWDPFKNAFTVTNETWDSPLYTPKRIFLHHYGHPLPVEPDGVGLYGSADTKYEAELFLQILNGVRIEEMTDWEAVAVYSIAMGLKMETVIRYCEEWFTRNMTDLSPITIFAGTHSKCFLKWMLKNSLDDRELIYAMVAVLNHFNEEDVESEHMKAVVKKLFSLA